MSDSSSGSSWLERLGKVFSDEPESREELITVLKDAQAQGVLDSDAFLMIEGVLDVSEARVRDIMVPRPQIEIIDANESLESILEMMLESSHSRYPVMSGKEIVGILLAKDVLRAVVKGELKDKDDLQKIYREANFIPESKRLNVLLREFKSSRNHLALVVDEYAELAGLVTIEDVLEQIVGDIEDEHDIAEDECIQKRTAGTFSVQALTTIEEFNQFFGTKIETENTETMGGFLSAELWHVPVIGEEIESNGIHFRVLKATDRRAELFEAKPVEQVEAEAAEEVDSNAETP